MNADPEFITSSYFPPCPKASDDRLLDLEFAAEDWNFSPKLLRTQSLGAATTHTSMAKLFAQGYFE